MNPIYIVTNRRKNILAESTWELFHDDKFIDERRNGAELQCVRIDNPTKNSTYKTMLTLEAFLEMQETMMNKKLDAIYYGHGFNNSFEDVIKGYFELQKLTGQMVFGFSWPSNMTGLPFEDYREKKKFAMQSVPAFDRVMEKLYRLITTTDKSCGQKIHAVIHSMHNYLWQGAVKGQGCYSSRKQIFDNVVIAEADINAKGSEDYLSLINCRGKKFVTVNKHDAPLNMSQAKFGKKQRRRRGTTIHPMMHDHDDVVIVDFTKAKKITTDHTFFKGHKNSNVNNFFKDVFTGGDGTKHMTEVTPDKLYRIS